MGNMNSILSSFKQQGDLNSKIWSKSKGQEYKMDPKVRSRLLEISYEFVSFLDVNIIVSDIIMTGSLSNFNWSKYSDVDLHILVDFDQFSEQELPLYEELFRLKKTIYNDKHNITIYGYDVEVYVQNEFESHFSSGVYSFFPNDWLVKPKKENVNIDKSLIKSKAKQWMDIIDSVIENAKDVSLDESKRMVKKYKEKLKKYRTCGLEKNGENSNENIVFKILRRNGYIEKLHTFQTKQVDKLLSLKESSQINFSNPVGSRNITSKYGERWGKKHHGVDIAVPSGTVVVSPANGRVIDAEIRNNSCGGTLYIDHGGGIKTRYCHLKRIDVRKGDTIKQGETVGLTGGGPQDIGKGRSTGAHLHFELYQNGKTIDPEPFIVSGKIITPSQSSVTNYGNTETENNLNKFVQAGIGQFFNPNLT
jgi:murein DD-endopeptidase MepM/ murein hydrolase activator NlpD